MDPTYRSPLGARPNLHACQPDSPVDGRSNADQPLPPETISTPHGPAMSTRRRQRDISADPTAVDGAPVAKKVRLDVQSSHPAFETIAGVAVVPEGAPAVREFSPAELVKPGNLPHLRACLRAGRCEAQAKASLLQEAACAGSLKSFNLLLESGVLADYRRLQPGLPANRNRTLFQAAILGQNMAVLDRLEEVDCRIAERSRDELKQAIAVAAANSGLKMLQRLCNAADSARIRWEPADMGDFFDAAVRLRKAYPANWGNYLRGCTVMAYLSKRYPDRFDAGVYSRSLLTAVNSSNWEEAAELLGTYGANPNVTDARGKSVLMTAALAGRLDMYELLRFHGASPHALDHNGSSVLHYAARGSNEAIVRDLVMKCGVVTNKINNDGITPLRVAQGPDADHICRIIAIRPDGKSAEI